MVKSDLPAAAESSENTEFDDDPLDRPDAAAARRPTPPKVTGNIRPPPPHLPSRAFFRNASPKMKFGHCTELAGMSFARF